MLLPALLATGFLHSAQAQGEGFNYFNGLSGDEWVKANENEARAHFAKWQAATGAERVQEAQAVHFYAWRAEKPELIDAVIADGRLAETEVKVPATAQAVPVTIKLEVPKVPAPYEGYLVWRRITPGAFEIWNSAQGWLFNARGRLVQTAKVPRRGGGGREWLGAFLPDGRWITTELLEQDGRVYIFNDAGKCTHEIKSGNLLHDPAWHNKVLIIPWARSLKNGKEWLVRIGSEEGRGEALLKPDGSSQRAGTPPSIWQRCEPRQLGVRLFAGICNYEIQSDDGTLEMTSEQPQHGQDVGDPAYTINSAKGEEPLGKLPSEGRGFGFWQRSHATYVFTGTRTWFFDAQRKYQGWIAGERVGDAADGRSMIFRQPDGRCVTLGPDLKVTAVQTFQQPDGARLIPLELQSDLGMGVFGSKPVAAGRDCTSEDLLDSNPTVIVARWQR